MTQINAAASVVLLGSAWRVLCSAQKQGLLATTGTYSYVRHLQYVGFIVIMFGFLLQWPTLLSWLMFPFLVAMYVHLAHTEKAEALHRIGWEYERYAAVTPRWIPHLGGPPGRSTAHML